jgi:hypothetical protein
MNIDYSAHFGGLGREDDIDGAYNLI